jgi:hypothetical protein
MDPAELIGSALATASDRQLVRALTVLTRASEGRDAVARAARDALDRHLPELVERAVSVAGDDEFPHALSLAVTLIQPGTGAVAAMDSLPAAAGRLAGLVTQVLLIAALALETMAGDGGDELLAERAGAHGRLATLFTEQGQQQWAVAAGRRAVEIRRLLVERDGEEQIDGLATALNNLSVSLHETSQIEESLKANEEATALFRRLAEADPEAHLSSLANALANLSVSLAETGQDDEALAAAHEAASTLADAGTAGEERAERARVLHNLSVRLAARGRDTEALQAIEKAVRIRRDLAESGLDRFRADLASSLSNYSVRLGAVGRQAEALASIEEAVRIRRELAATDPDRYLPALATSLNNLSVDLTRAGRPAEDSLAATAEAVRIRRTLARAQPDRYCSDLAAALHNMSADLAAAGQDSRALDAIQEAVAIRHELAATRPYLYAADLASSLRNLSIRLAAAGRPTVAVDAAKESVGIIRSLAERQPDAFRPELATSLSTLSSRLGAVGRHQEALAAVEECARLRRALATAAPDAYLSELAISLNNLSVSLSRVGQPQQALAAAEETVQIRRSLAAARPRRYAADLATSLNTLGVDLGDAGRHREALAALQEAVRLLRPLAASHPRSAVPDLVMSLNNVCEQLGTLGQRAEAGQLFAELLTEHHGDPWATALILLGRAQWSAEGGNVAVAITHIRDAIDLLQEDAPAQAKARRFLRSLRWEGPEAFDQAWDHARGNLPAWLRHLDHDQILVEQIHRWIDSPDLEDEEALLAANPGLACEEAEAILDHLIDDNPGNQWLHMHRDLIRAARAASVEDAYAQHRKLLWREGVTKALATWFGAASEELRDVMTKERVLLLSDEATSQAESTLAMTTRTPDLIWRMGLLTLCRCDGEEAAFQVSADPDTLRQPPGSRALTDFEPRDLALARLRAGLDPDDPEAAFVHAVLALAATLAAEADEAIGRCAGASPSWDRRARAVHLTELTSIRPDLAEDLTRLRSIMAGSERAINVLRPALEARSSLHSRSLLCHLYFFHGAEHQERRGGPARQGTGRGDGRDADRGRRDRAQGAARP